MHGEDVLRTLVHPGRMVRRHPCHREACLVAFLLPLWCTTTTLALPTASTAVGRLLQSAAAADPQCTDLPSRTDALNDECCDEATEDCSSGRPATCNIGYARVLLPFFDDCRTALAVDTVAEFDDIVALCQRTMEIEDPLPVQCFIRGDDVAYETFVCSPDSPAWSTDGFTVRSAHGVSAVPGCATSTWTENAAQSCPAPAGHAGEAGGSSGSGDESTCVAIMAESTDDVASDLKSCVSRVRTSFGWRTLTTMVSSSQSLGQSPALAASAVLLSGKLATLSSKAASPWGAPLCNMVLFPRRCFAQRPCNMATRR